MNKGVNIQEKTSFIWSYFNSFFSLLPSVFLDFIALEPFHCSFSSLCKISQNQQARGLAKGGWDENLCQDDKITDSKLNSSHCCLQRQLCDHCFWQWFGFDGIRIYIWRQYSINNHLIFVGTQKPCLPWSAVRFFTVN